MEKINSVPDDERSRELWMQNAAGFLLMNRVRQYSMERLDEALIGDARNAAIAAIDDTIYGLLMLSDGISPGVLTDDIVAELSIVVTLRRLSDDQVLDSLDLRDGDGACMGFQSWIRGDFGNLVDSDNR